MKTSWAAYEVGFDFCNANLNPVWAMTACYDCPGLEILPY